MASRPHEVTFSTGLLEKLAGLKKPEPVKPLLPRPPLQGIQLPTKAPISHDAARIIAQDKQLTRQLQAAKEVAGLLLKHEEEELKKVSQKAAELLKEHSISVKPPVCSSEAAACAQCFKENAKEAWRCMEAAEAYRQCANTAFASSRAARG